MTPKVGDFFRSRAGTQMWEVTEIYETAADTRYPKLYDSPMIREDLFPMVKLEPLYFKRTECCLASYVVSVDSEPQPLPAPFGSVDLNLRTGFEPVSREEGQAFKDQLAELDRQYVEKHGDIMYY